jgi:hypothetical protein
MLVRVLRSRQNGFRMDVIPTESGISLQNFSNDGGMGRMVSFFHFLSS